MKTIYEFTLTKETEIEEPTTTKNEKGESVTVVKKVKKDIPTTFFIRRPNRSLNDEAELYYGSEMAKAVKAGFLTSAQLSKRFKNDGGTLSEDEKQEYLKLLQELVDLESDFYKLGISNLTGDSENKKKQIILRLNSVKESIRQFEMSQSSLFEQTAEVYARNRIIMWYVLHLSYKLEDTKEIPIFGDGTFEDKLVAYDQIEDQEDEFLLNAIRRLLILITAWYTGAANNKEDFDEIIKTLTPQDLKQLATAQEPAPDEAITPQDESDPTPPAKTASKAKSK